MGIVFNLRIADRKERVNCGGQSELVLVGDIEVVLWQNLEVVKSCTVAMVAGGRLLVPLSSDLDACVLRDRFFDLDGQHEFAAIGASRPSGQDVCFVGGEGIFGNQRLDVVAGDRL